MVKFLLIVYFHDTKNYQSIIISEGRKAIFNLVEVV